jgi:FKBP-type peptidyl-prolyl cis-trans isomerase (trigger factor)
VPPKDQDMAQALYGSSQRAAYENAIKPNLDKLTDALGMTEQQRKQSASAWADLAADLELPSARAEALHSLYTKQVLELHEKRELNPETLNQWGSATRSMLRERFASDADARLKEAHAFVQSKPELWNTLEETGLGSNPEVVATLIEAASRAKARGKLKVPKNG